MLQQITTSTTNSTVRNSLFIEFGGTGQQIVGRVLNYEDNDHTAARVFDTHLEDFQDVLTPYFRKYDISRARKILANRTRYPHINKQLRLEACPSLGKAEGTGQFILTGSLLYAASIHHVHRAVKQATKELLQSSADTESNREKTSNAYENRLNVFVISSLAGGTGSGAWPFAIFHIRQIMRQLVGEEGFRLIAIGILPGPFKEHVNDKEKVNANCGSAIHMIDQFSKGEERTISFGEEPEQKIKVGIGTKPGWIYLVSNMNKSKESAFDGGTALSLGEVYDMVANFINYNRFSPFMSQLWAQDLQNLSKESFLPIRNHPTPFSSFGIGEMVLQANTAYQWAKAYTVQELINVMCKEGEE